MDVADRIELAHAPEFMLGRLTVRPAERELVRDDGAREVVEPRVMQVLIALVDARGGVVTRDALTRRCWDGRVVGEDAINRVISRLRRAAETIGAGSFRIETLTKVGYRLIAEAAGDAPGPATAHVPPRSRLPRRALIGGAAGLALLGAGAWFAVRDTRQGPPAAVVPLMEEGMKGLRQVSSEGNAQAIASFRRTTELAPDYADGWGALALGYATASHYSTPRIAAELAARTRAATRRARALDADNPLAEAALGTLLPRIGHWRASDDHFRKALARAPDDGLLLTARANLLLSAGRCREAAALLDPVARLEQPAPHLLYTRVLALWAANRFEETDAALELGHALYPLHFALWFARVYAMMFGGRGREALALLGDRETRPRGIPDGEFENVAIVAHAMLSSDPAQRRAAIGLYAGLAHRGAGYAENAIQFAAAMGDLDTGFRIADAYFLGRGFAVPALRFAGGQGTYTRREDRRSHILFLPPTAPMRADPRFGRLVGEIGLERYWRESGARPDYRAAMPS